MANNIRVLIDGVYDMQKLRIATGNRVVAVTSSYRNHGEGEGR